MKIKKYEDEKCYKITIKIEVKLKFWKLRRPCKIRTSSFREHTILIRGDDMSFPEQLKKARLNMDYTQQQVADLMGITKSTYCGYETGKRQPDVAKIKRLACILNTSGDILLETGFEPKTSFENITNESDIDSDVKLLEKQYILLSASDRELIKRMINSLIEKTEKI